jgi:hypothetical protein
MANYESRFRTNYFRVKSEDAFCKWAYDIGADYSSLKIDGGVGWVLTRQGSVPDFSESREEEIDFASELSEHLVEGEVAIYMEVGYEKLRYLSGVAVAVAWDGRVTYVDLNEIYERAREEFGMTAPINRAEY